MKRPGACARVARKAAPAAHTIFNAGCRVHRFTLQVLSRGTFSLFLRPSGDALHPTAPQRQASSLYSKGGTRSAIAALGMRALSAEAHKSSQITEILP